jgi:hypothetical protein
MACPPEISEIVLGLLETGLLRVRSLGWSGQGQQCGVEADHVHNLPGLLANFSQDKLRFYWEVERPSYMDRIPPDHLAAWEPLWERLRPFAEPVISVTYKY